ncbi:adenylate cyclase type 8-like [Cherax quadricarinatus]|uniref:adenylate cyclase type 8-like n=1 Tax=Cherax quadricarinatus TaxID=27406 RepID=UPI00387EE5B2
MAEEFPVLPVSLRRLSTRLARATFGRKAFICALMAIISLPSMLTLILVRSECLETSNISQISRGVATNYGSSSVSLMQDQGHGGPLQSVSDSRPLLGEDNRFSSIPLSFLTEAKLFASQGSSIRKSRNYYRTTYDQFIPILRTSNINSENMDYLDGEKKSHILDKVSNKQKHSETTEASPLDNISLVKRSTESFSFNNISTTFSSLDSLIMFFNRSQYSISAMKYNNLMRDMHKDRTLPVQVKNQMWDNYVSELRTRVRRHSEQQLIEVKIDSNNVPGTANSDIHMNKTKVYRAHDGIPNNLANIAYEHLNVENKTVVYTPAVEEELHVCVYPQYFVYTWVLCMVALASFLKLNYLVKTIVLVFMITCYGLLIIKFSSIFDPVHSGISLPFRMAVLLVLFFFMVSYHGRLVEITSRLDFVWKQQALRELTDMSECRLYNTQLLKNILPDHVANYFLSEDRKGEELFSKAYENVGVLFASIPNFTQFYSEDVNRGMECIRLLNEIIADFDELLDEDRFTCIEKIKTIGSTYMAASGLNPTEKDVEDSHAHLCALVDFALEMKARLEEVNKHSFNNFRLRVGISHGPLVGGVIGAKKPVFDVWGNTVNEASRMDSTGASDTIQIPKETAQILNFRGFRLQYRGKISVKGKGEMDTYFVLGRKASRQMPFSRHPSTYNSLAEVVYGMVQARKKQTIKRSNTTVKRDRQRKVSPSETGTSTASSGLGSRDFTPGLSRRGGRLEKTASSHHNLRSLSRDDHRQEIQTRGHDEAV